MKTFWNVKQIQKKFGSMEYLLTTDFVFKIHWKTKWYNSLLF